MKRNKYSKKIISAVIAITALLSTMTIGHANQKINLNHGNVEFNNLLIVEDGITYIPLRLAINRNMAVSEDGKVSGGYSPDYNITVEPFIDRGYVTLSLRRKDTSGNLFNEGRYVKISWSDEVKNLSYQYINGMMDFIQYDVKNGNNIGRIDVAYDAGLKNKIKLEPLNDQGDRLFISTEDLATIINFLTDGNDYKVEIINE